MSCLSPPAQSFAAAPIKTRRFPGVLFSHNELEAYIRKVAVSRTLDCSGALLNNNQDTAFICNFLAAQQISFESMNFGSCQLTPEGLETLLGKELKELTTFIIRDNLLKKAAGYVIAKLLGSRGQIKIFDVQNNLLGDVGISSIAGGFTSELNDVKLRAPYSPIMLSKLSLQELDLSGNDIGDLGVMALCSGLSVFVRNAYRAGQNISLKILRLNRNRITDKGALSVAQLIDLGILSEIDSNNKRRSGAIPESGCEEHSLPLLLEELCLSDNPIGSEGACNILIAASSLPGESRRPIQGIEQTIVPDQCVPPTPLTDAVSRPYPLPKGVVMLRRIELARCSLSLESLSALSAYLTSTAYSTGPTDHPIHIDFRLTDEQASSILSALTCKYESTCNVQSTYSNSLVLTAILKQLASAVRRNERISQVLLGALPSMLRRWGEALKGKKVQSWRAGGYLGDSDSEGEENIPRNSSDSPVSYRVPPIPASVRDRLLRDITGSLEVLHIVKRVLESGAFDGWVPDRVLGGEEDPHTAIDGELLEVRAEDIMSVSISGHNQSLNALHGQSSDSAESQANSSRYETSTAEKKSQEWEWDIKWGSSYDYLSPKKILQDDMIKSTCGSTDGSLSTSVVEEEGFSLQTGRNSRNMHSDRYRDSYISSLQTSPLTPPYRTVLSRVGSDTEVGGKGGIRDTPSFPPPYSPSNMSVFMTELPDDAVLDGECVQLKVGDISITSASFGRREDTGIEGVAGEKVSEMRDDRIEGEWNESMVEAKVEKEERIYERGFESMLYGSQMEPTQEGVGTTNQRAVEVSNTTTENTEREEDRAGRCSCDDSVVSMDSRRSRSGREPFKRERSRERVAQQLSIGRYPVPLTTASSAPALPPTPSFYDLSNSVPPFNTPALPPTPPCYAASSSQKTVTSMLTSGTERKKWGGDRDEDRRDGDGDRRGGDGDMDGSRDGDKDGYRRDGDMDRDGRRDGDGRRDSQGVMGYPSRGNGSGSGGDRLDVPDKRGRRFERTTEAETETEVEADSASSSSWRTKVDFNELSPEQSDLLETLISEMELLEKASAVEGGRGVVGVGVGAVEPSETRVTDTPRVKLRTWHQNETSDASISTTGSGWDPKSPGVRDRDRDPHSGQASPCPTVSTESDMQSLVQKAVDEALDKAQRQWLSALAPVLLSMRSSSNTNTAITGLSPSSKSPSSSREQSRPLKPSNNPPHKPPLHRSISEGSESTVQGTDPGSYLAPTSQGIHRPGSELPSRHNKGVGIQGHDSDPDPSLEEQELSARLTALESDIEFEHDASIQVLDALLCQHFKLSQQHKIRQGHTTHTPGEEGIHLGMGPSPGVSRVSPCDAHRGGSGRFPYDDSSSPASYERLNSSQRSHRDGDRARSGSRDRGSRERDRARSGSRDRGSRDRARSGSRERDRDRDDMHRNVRESHRARDMSDRDDRGRDDRSVYTSPSLFRAPAPFHSGSSGSGCDTHSLSGKSNGPYQSQSTPGFRDDRTRGTDSRPPQPYGGGVRPHTLHTPHMSAYIRPTRSSLLKATHQQTMYKDHRRYRERDRDVPQAGGHGPPETRSGRGVGVVPGGSRAKPFIPPSSLSLTRNNRGGTVGYPDPMYRDGYGDGDRGRDRDVRSLQQHQH